MSTSLRKLEIFSAWTSAIIPVPAMSATGLAYAAYVDFLVHLRKLFRKLVDVRRCPRNPQMSVPLSKPADFCGHFSISAGAIFLRTSTALGK